VALKHTKASGFGVGTVHSGTKHTKKLRKGASMSETSENFKVDMEHLQKVHRTIRKAGNIFPNEQELVKALEEEITKAQDENSLNTYYNMAQYLKQRLKEVKQHLSEPQPGIDEAIKDLTWSINYLQWLVTENKKES
jgi:division protein CdvB (Snf7/Vps24/ESCRT-III family)